MAWGVCGPGPPDCGVPDQGPMGAALTGRAMVETALNERMLPVPTNVSSRHMTADHIVAVDGDTAHLSAHFVRLRSVPARPPVRLARWRGQQALTWRGC
ncbi:nuclear transport factor 2 family protein [Streptomyces sp. NPDC092369]|uniref:nuclear transport factor 2 family protein n=1 Tax=Streptomyces sp. NPDC092369 TaxID=3366015 RepID=UPI0037F18382